MHRPDSPPPADPPSDPPHHDMPRHEALHPAPGGEERTTPEPKRVAAEFQFLLIALALVMMIALAGVPGEPEKAVGDGSDALKQGWAERQAQAQLQDYLPPPPR